MVELLFFDSSFSILILDSNSSPHRLGAWHLGWIVIACVLSVFAIIMAFFPKELPRAALRRRIAAEIEKRNNTAKLDFEEKKEDSDTSLKGFYIAFKRLLENKIFMLNNFAGIFYIFG
jgi:Na+/melibiose symporter-like transporter